MKIPCDRSFGGVKSCRAEWDSDEWKTDIGTCIPNPTPLAALCAFSVVYENGKTETLVARGEEILTSRLFQKSSDFFKGEETDERYIGDERLLARVVDALANAQAIPSGDVTLPTLEEARETLSKYGIAVSSIELDDEACDRIKHKWIEDWMESGILVKPGDLKKPVTKWLWDEWMEDLKSKA